MPVRLNVNLTSIILIVVLVVAVIFFMKFYTPARLKEAIRAYNTLVDSLPSENEKLYAARDSLATEYDDMKTKYADLQINYGTLRRKNKEAIDDLKRKIAMIADMPLDSIIEHTRIYLNQYQAAELAVTPNISNKDIYRIKNSNTIWSQVPVRTNFYILTEHNSYKSVIIPNLTEQCTTLTVMNNNLEQQVVNREEMIGNIQQEVEHERMMHDQCAKTLDICKKQLRFAQWKFFGIGLAVGIPVGVGSAVLIRSALD